MSVNLMNIQHAECNTVVFYVKVNKATTETIKREMFVLIHYFYYRTQAINIQSSKLGSPHSNGRCKALGI